MTSKSFDPLTAFPAGVGSPTGLPAVPKPPTGAMQFPMGIPGAPSRNVGHTPEPVAIRRTKMRRMGRIQPKERTRIRLHRYRVAKEGTTPIAPTSKDYSPEAKAALSLIYLNDELGCCVIAGGYHVVGVETGNADGGTPFLATDTQILGDYEPISGYVPGKPDTDNGCVETDAFAYWTTVGFANGTKLLGWAGVDGSVQAHVEDAMFLFENLVFAVNLPNEWIANIQGLKDGDTWDVAGAPNPDNGHCVIGVGYNEQGVLVATWGMVLLLTWAAVAKYCVEEAGGDIYVLFTPDQLAKGQTVAPNGYAWSDLQEDMSEVERGLPIPPPKPAPASPGVTLANAVQWAMTAKDVSRILAIEGAPGLDADASVISAFLTAHWPK